jgi:hypothetical protein
MARCFQQSSPPRLSRSRAYNARRGYENSIFRGEIRQAQLKIYWFILTWPFVAKGIDRVMDSYYRCGSTALEIGMPAGGATTWTSAP